jgi:hypothetical protein
MTTSTEAEGAASTADPITPRFTERLRSLAIPAVLAAFVVVVEMRVGVELSEILRYAIYWVVAVLLPGRVVARASIGARTNAVEDTAVAAATGVSLEIVCWTIGVLLGLGSLTRLWFVPVLVIGAAVPRLRSAALRPVEARMPVWHSVALAALAAQILVRLDVSGVRKAPLPPQGGTLFQDLWWHLSLVQEMMRFERPEVPQVVGEPLRYHVFAHVHLGSASSLSGVAPDVVLLRLWFVPVVLACIGLAWAVGRALTGSSAVGVATAWLAFGVFIGSYVWPGVTAFGADALVYSSPSQLLTALGVMAVALGITTLLRTGHSSPVALWTCLAIVGASGMKSTVVPLLIAGTLVALGWSLVSRAGATTLLAGLLGVLVLVQVLVLALASGTSGGQVTLFGTLKSFPAYTDLVPGVTYRGLNDGLLLDSISSWRTAAFAALALGVFYVMHSIRLVGTLTLTQRRGRADLVNWWLSGFVLAGYAMAMVIDHVGLSQNFFLLTAAPLGAALTSSTLWTSSQSAEVARRSTIATGLAFGCALTLIVDYAVRARQRSAGFGALERLLVPAFVAALILAIGLAWWATRARSMPLLALFIACTIGVVVPSQVEIALRTTYQWLQTVEYATDSTHGDFVSTGELEAMLWLRDHSDADDVMLTNLHCRPPAYFPTCDARGFWSVGLSGRRAVLEGWAYTDEVQPLQGVDDLVYARQPAPWVDRFDLNRAVFEQSDPDALSELVDDYGARWIVAIHRAGGIPVLPDDLASVRFDNGEVTILEVATDP